MISNGFTLLSDDVPYNGGILVSSGRVLHLFVNFSWFTSICVPLLSKRPHICCTLYKIFVALQTIKMNLWARTWKKTI